MPDYKDKIVLDDAAAKLYEMLGGLDTSDRVDAKKMQEADSQAGLIGSLMEQEKQLDQWRCLLVELGILLGRFLMKSQKSSQTPGSMTEIKTIVESTTAIVKQIPDNDGSVTIRFRGRCEPGESVEGAELDYVLLTGHVMVDMSKVKDLSKRLGAPASHLPGQLFKAFEGFSRLDINNMHLTIGTGQQDALDQLERSLQFLGCYFKNSGNTSIVKEQEQRQDSSQVIFNENQHADPNLTVLADLNRLKRESVQEIVTKIDDMMRRPDAPPELARYASVYDAIFAFKKFKDKLVKPLVEVNNIRWLMVKKDRESVSGRKIQLSRTVAGLFADSPKKVARIMESIYGCDYRDIIPADLQGNLSNVTTFLESIGTRDIDPLVRRETLDNLQQGLDQAPDELLDNLTISGEAITSPNDTENVSPNKISAELLDMFSFFKKRVSTKKKLRQMLHEPIDFDTQDLHIIARDFTISAEEAKHLVAMMKECFTSEGRFDRRTFERYIPRFLNYEKKIFDFLWYYLKEIRFREDRVSYLNSLQLLIAEMTQPQLALRCLLMDFIHSPRTVSFSDRNALILANILLRKYNKELNNYIENTPEEVLLVQEGLNREMTESAKELIEQDHDRYLQKVRTIHNKLLETIKPTQEGIQPMTLRYLSTVEREIFILFSLVGGTAAHKIMKSVVTEYGNPEAYIYSLINNQEQMKTVFQLLQLSVRGLMRFNDISALAVLEKIKAQEWIFAELNPELLPKETITRVMEFVDLAIKKLSGA